jgi:hypothetical protein
MADELRKEDLEAEFPAWEVTTGMLPGNGVRARLKNSDPPVMTWGENWADLRDQIIKRIRQRQRTENLWPLRASSQP